MNVSIEKLPECRAILTAEVPAGTVTSTRDEVLTLFMAQANLPGFRPGKLPKNVVQKKFGPKIEEEVRERLTRDILRKAIHEDGLELLGISKVNRELFSDDGMFTYESEVVTKPEVELTKEDYMAIPVEVIKNEFDDSQMDSFMSRVQTNFATYKDVDRPAERGDQIKVEYTSTRDGEPFIESVDEQRKYLAETDEPLEFTIPEEPSPYEPVPGLLQAIVGMKAGEEKEVEVDFGEDYYDESLKNVKAVYKVNLHKVSEAELPEVNDALAQQVGAENLEALQNNFREGHAREAEQQRNNQIEQGILEHLNKEHEFQLPQQAVFNETQYMVNQMVVDATKQGMNPEDLDEHEEKIIETAGARATNNLRTRYLLDEIAKNEGITVSDDELTQQIVYEAQSAGKPIKKFARELRDGVGLDTVRSNMLIGKTIAFLKDNATITEVDPPEPEAEQAASDEEE